MSKKNTFLGITFIGWYIILITAIVVLFCSCSITESLRTYEGKIVDVPVGMMLTRVTFEKDSSLLLYMESMDSAYIPKTKVLQRNSKYGIVEQKILFRESRLITY